jgi:surfactin synthase thioesterase subunit/NAD(P)-dependent dehydrogenase (short-subunit alcohol dehydrogenase family)/aryl carrier-like protein
VQLLELRCVRSADREPTESSLDPTRNDHIEALFRRLAAVSSGPVTLLRCQAGSRANEPAQALDGVLAEPAALAQGLTGSGCQAAIEWVYITAHAQPVLGVERIAADLACTATAVLVLPRELPNLRARWLDVDRSDCPLAAARSAAAIADELAREADFQPVAFRHGRRWQREYRRIAPAAEPAALRSKGRYVITGGLGRMGLSLAEHLVSEYGARVALVHRTELPPRARFGELASDTAEVASIAQIVSTLLKLEERGAELELVRADVSCSEQMSALFARLEDTWGAVDGVFHLAATFEERTFGMLHDATPSTADANSGPKLRGAQVLAALTARHAVGFCCLASSVSSEFGGLGNFGYASSNRALDVMAHRFDGEHGTRWVSVALDYYRPQAAEDGRADPRERKGALQRLLSEGVLRGRDLLVIFERALALRAVPNVVACALPIERHVTRFEKSLATRREKTTRPDLTSAYRGPQLPVESQLVEIWEELLGVSPIGVRDDFFELGGDSLLAMRLVQLCRDRLGLRTTVKSLLGSPSIERFVKLVDASDEGVEMFALKSPATARHTLVCVPYAGGTELAFKPLAAELPEDFEVLVVPPLRNVRERERMLEKVLAELMHVQSPLYIYGHCGGSSVAVELARRLELEGRPAACVFAAAFLPPLEGVTISDAALGTMAGGGDLATFMRSLGGLPEIATEADALEAAANMHEDGVRLGELFEHFRELAAPRPLATPLVCLFGSADPLTAGWEQRVSHWQRYFRDSRSVTFLDRGHYFVHSEPELVADVLRRVLTPDREHAMSAATDGPRGRTTMEAADDSH